MASSFKLQCIMHTRPFETEFNSLKALNQYVSRNNDVIKSYKRFIYLDGSYQAFVTKGNLILTLSDLTLLQAQLLQPL